MKEKIFKKISIQIPILVLSVILFISLAGSEFASSANLSIKNDKVNYHADWFDMNITLQKNISNQWQSLNTLFLRENKFGALDNSNKSIENYKYILRSSEEIKKKSELEYYISKIDYFKCDNFDCESEEQHIIDFKDICDFKIGIKANETGETRIIFDPECDFSPIYLENNLWNLEVTFFAPYNKTLGMISIDPTINVGQVNQTSSIKNNITTENYPLSHITMNSSNVYLYMPFDLGNISNNIIYDFSTKDNDLSLNGGARINSTALIGQALNLRGGSTVDDVRGTFTYSSITAGTVSFWTRVYTNRQNDGFVTSASDRFITSNEGLTDPYLRFLLKNSVGTIVLDMFNSSDTLALNSWAHFVVTWNSTEAFIYRDGTKRANKTLSGTPGSISGSNLHIGGSEGVTDRYLHGSIDDVMFSNLTSSSSEIARLFKNQSYRHATPAIQTFGIIDIEQGSSLNKINITTNTTYNFGTNITVRISEIYPENYSSGILPKTSDLWYRFDNSTGENQTFARDFGSRAINISCASCGLTNSSGGKYFRSTYLDGSNNEWNAGDTDFIGNITILAWININSSETAGTSDIVVKHASAMLNGEWALQYNLVPISNVIQFNCGGTSSAGTTKVPRNQWHFIGVTFNENTDAGALYVDGDKVTFTNTDSCLIDDTESLAIGGDQSANNGQFIGRIDDVMLFQKILTDNEINQIYIKGGFNSSLSAWQKVGRGDNNVTSFDISPLSNYTILEFNYTTDSNNFYSPVLRDNIVVKTWNEPTPPTATSSINISFVPPTLANGTSTTNITIPINVSIISQNLANIILNWNKTNYTIYDNSLILYYNFDNRSALGENDTHVKDLSIYGNNATVIGSKWINNGRYNGAYNFTPNANNKSIQISNANAKSIPGINITDTPFTWSIWVQKQDNSTNGANGNLIDIYRYNSGCANGYNVGCSGSYLRITNTQLIFNAVIDNKTYGIAPKLCTFTASFYPQPMEWHNYVVTHNGTRGANITLYADGRILGHSLSSSCDGNWTSGNEVWGSTGTGAFCIGQDCQHSGSGANATIDNVKIWKRSLNSSEIQELYFINLAKFNQTQWYLFINQSKNSTAGLNAGAYTYYAFASNNNGNSNSTETRSITITASSSSNASSDFNLTYDANGNMGCGLGKNYTYDAFNQLIKVTNSTNGRLLEQYAYDHDGNRIKQIEYNYVNGINKTTYYISDNFIQIRYTNGTIYNETYYYADNKLVAKKDNNGNKTYYHPDHLGSTTLVTNQSKDIVEEEFYLPFGDVYSGSEDSRFLFTSKELDKLTDLYYYGARYYQASVMRMFIQPDSIIADVYNPQSLNRYSYVLNNPYKYVDPTGNEPITFIAATLIAIDIAFTIHDVIQTIQNPQDSSNYFNLALDATGLGPVSKAGKIASKIDDVADALKAGEKVSEKAGDAIKTADVTDKLRGTADPRIKSSIQEGMKEHQSFYEKMGGEGFVTNKQIPGTKLRPDALNPKTNTIIELKPDSPSGLRAGQRQIEKYEKAAKESFGGKWKAFIETYKGKFGGGNK